MDMAHIDSEAEELERLIESGEPLGVSAEDAPTVDGRVPVAMNFGDILLYTGDEAELIHHPELIRKLADEWLDFYPPMASFPTDMTDEITSRFHRVTGLLGNVAGILGGSNTDPAFSILADFERLDASTNAVSVYASARPLMMRLRNYFPPKENHRHGGKRNQSGRPAGLSDGEVIAIYESWLRSRDAPKESRVLKADFADGYGFTAAQFDARVIKRARRLKASDK